MGRAVAHVDPPTSRARGLLGLDGQILELGSARILFREGLPLAATTGGYTYFPDFTLKQGESRAVNVFTEGTQVRVPSESFDFIVGQILAQTGLKLTALPKEEHRGEA